MAAPSTASTAPGAATETPATTAPPPNSSYDYAWNPLPTTFDYFTHRYYHQYLCTSVKGVEGNHCRLLQHSNGLCIVTLDPTHVAVQRTADKANDVRVSSVVFGSRRKRIDVTPDSIKVVGKKKKNAMMCQEDTQLCTVMLSDGSEYAIPACVSGFVLELNAALVEQPWLLTAAPGTEGFIAVINPSAKADLSRLYKVWTATGGDARAEGEDDD